MHVLFHQGGSQREKIMAPVALAFFFVFILYSLRRESREHGRFPLALWVPFLWIIVSASRPISTWLSPNRALSASSLQDYIQGNPTERIYLVILISLGLFILVGRRGSFILPLGPNIWLFALYIFALMSVSWADYQGVSFRRWIRAIGDIIMVLVMLTEKDTEAALERILHRSAIILIPLSVLLVKWYRVYGILYNPHGAPFWAGVSTGKNELGLLCAYLGVFLVWRAIRRWPKKDVGDALIFLMILYLLYGTNSSTSDVVLLAGTILLIVLTALKNDRRKFTAVVILAIVLVLLLQWLSIGMFGESITPLFFSATGRDATFTGRVLLWKELVVLGMRHPIGGAGYGNFWVVNLQSLWDKFNWGPTNGHNGLLDTYLDLGLVGLTILILLIVQTYRKLLASLGTGGEANKLLLVYFIMILAHNITETHILKPTNFLWLLFLFMAMRVKLTAAAHEADVDFCPEGPSPGS
jgi:exopolysaccharide production protein ExoQ